MDKDEPFAAYGGRKFRAGTPQAARRAALLAGVRTYQGKPCRVGHCERYANNKKCVACVLAKSARRYEAQRGRALELQKRYYRANSQKVLAYAKKWRATPRGAERQAVCGMATRHARRARLLGVESDALATKAARASMRFSADQCPRCQGAFRSVRDRQLDHVVPLARGGPDVIGNLQLLCARCNRQKGCKVA